MNSTSGSQTSFFQEAPDLGWKGQKCRCARLWLLFQDGEFGARWHPMWTIDFVELKA